MDKTLLLMLSFPWVSFIAVSDSNLNVGVNAVTGGQ